jgi:rhodanese-related sulfurtransferase
MTLLRELSLERKLAVAAFLLGVLALVAGNPYGGGAVTLDTGELAAIVEGKVDHVAPGELADWIIAGRADYRLIDLRTEAEFAEYRIPTAENIPITGLADAGLLRNEKIVLYSEGGIHSAQAWMLLRARGYKGVYILFGGLEEWKDKVLFPVEPVNPTPDQAAAFEKAKQVSAHFGGSPQTASGTTQATVRQALPKLQMPAAAPAAAPGGKKAKKEGC